jgi:hypothetical protein
MYEAIWLAGLLFANQWGPTFFQPEQPTEKGLLGGAAVGSGAGALIGSATPVPVQPWVADTVQERQASANDYRVPIMPALKPGERPTCDVPPDRYEILRALPRITAVPYVYDEFRDDVEFTIEKLVDRVDPPRFFPLIGPAQLHHCHWKCTVYYTETIDSSFPFPFRAKRRRAEVVYIDKDRLHLHVTAPAPTPAPASQRCPAGFVSQPKAVKAAGQTEESEPVAKPAPARRDDMTSADVVRMSKKGISDAIILRQIELSSPVFNLTVDDIIDLHDQGVSEAVIRAMQERRTVN